MPSGSRKAGSCSRPASICHARKPEMPPEDGGAPITPNTPAAGPACQVATSPPRRWALTSQAPVSIAKLCLLSLVVMGLAHTVTRERLFEPLRRRAGGKETWLGYLVSCP